jgi:hypothetical protein
VITNIEKKGKEKTAYNFAVYFKNGHRVYFNEEKFSKEHLSN